MYAYSEDGGDTWRNNNGTVVGTVGSPIDLNSPNITIVAMDRTNTLMNQQAQTVDSDGRGLGALDLVDVVGQPSRTWRSRCALWSLWSSRSKITFGSLRAWSTIEPSTPAGPWRPCGPGSPCNP